MEESSTHQQLKKVDILRHRVERIEHICALMFHQARIDFKKSYGRVLDLLKIYVDPAFIQVLVHFWSPSLHCFEFPQFDLVPTLEEYELMLRWPKSAGVYAYRGAHITVDKVATLIKLPSHQSALVGSGNIKGWKFKTLEDHLSSLADMEDWSVFNKTLALIVFGTTLFPFYTDTVDHAAMDTFFSWDVHLRSLVPAILVDTLLSVNFCHQKQGKTLRCCLTLLYVWGITYFYASSYMGTLPDPLRNFSKIPLCRRYAIEWKAEVEHWSIDHFSWICPWFCPGDILIRCRDYPSIPLMGLKGCIVYSPKVAMRQLMRTQTVPSQEELGGLCFFRESVNLEEIHAICKAWEKPVYMGDRELGKARALVSVDYEEWRKRRGVPQPSTSLAPASADSELQDKVDALTKKLEIMGAQLRALEEKKQESSLIIDGLQRQCKKKDQEIEQLKNECADFNEEAILAAKVQKLNLDSRLQEVTAKIAHLEAEHEKQAQLIKMMQDDLTMTRSEVQKWWEVAHKRSTSLYEFREKKKKGLSQIGRICEERDRAIDKANELQALISFYKEKAKEAQTNCDNMSRAVHQQAEALARHVGEAKEEWNRHIDPPLDFFRLFRCCQNLLRSII
ncbi:hypothetical protein Fmac_005857 [Flemingia macrophylla]|uniref:DUF7745 domain-containing protein n=1 Tax=Flemingia macrophylla TaxID=520843 RepID=A0ABD1N8Z4_9FABA